MVATTKRCSPGAPVSEDRSITTGSRVSRAVTCEFCGNQRSAQAAEAGKVNEAKVDDLINFEKSTKYSDREKAALAYAEAITWRLDTDDKFWERLYKHFSEPELVELGCAIALTMGQQSWLRLLNIEHHQVMAGTAASMAPGFETAEAPFAPTVGMPSADAWRSSSSWTASWFRWRESQLSIQASVPTTYSAVASKQWKLSRATLS